MNTKIDIKSAAMGLMLGVLIMLCMAATTSTGNPVGRYQAVTSVNNGGIGGTCSLVIDTMTGKVWIGYSTPNGRTDEMFYKAKNSAE